MKSTLRKVYLRKRKTLLSGEYTRRNQLILAHFQKEFSSLKNHNIHVFLPITKQKEVDTWPLIEYVQRQDGRVIISRSDVNNNSMTHFFLDKKTELVTNKWGIPEPRSGKQAEVSMVDMILIPLIIADKRGNRIGYGKGYYDRFLMECNPKAQKIGLSLAPLVDKIENMEPFDVTLDSCIYPGGIHHFKR